MACFGIDGIVFDPSDAFVYTVFQERMRKLQKYLCAANCSHNE